MIIKSKYFAIYMLQNIKLFDNIESIELSIWCLNHTI
jgi:hypothetical protein